MSLLVIAYPTLSVKDYNWIQAIRRENDPIFYKLVEPHVTFVFPTNKPSKEELIKHVTQQLIPAFEVIFDTTKVTEEQDAETCHTFLVPSQGYDEVVTLHDALYTGIMASELRTDIPFIPHLGIGKNKDREVMESLSAELNKTSINIHGVINTLSLVEFENQQVTTFEEIALL